MKLRLKNKNIGKVIIIIVVVLTICFIWGNSMMPASVSDAFSRRAKEWVNIILSHTGSKKVLSGDGGLRKAAHATEFGLLGIELVIIWRNKLKGKLTALALSGLAAAVADETIQLYSPGRSSQLEDVWIDFIGFTAGVLLSWAVLSMVRGKNSKYQKQTSRSIN